MQRWLVSLLHLLALICLSSQARQLYGPNSSKPEVINDLEHDERLESNDCGQRPALAHATGSRVSGGYEAGRDEFPSFVSLKVYHGKQYSFCGGTILGPRLVLTAGHCIVGATMLSVSTSKYHPNHWPMSYDEPLLVKRSCRAANYTKTRNSARHDYGIVILEKALKFHGQVQPACLPDRPVEEHESFLAVGIGQVHHSGGVKKRPKVMQAIPMQPHLCKEQHRTSDKICFRSSDPRHVGATCKGDSGGPIYADRNGAQTVVGVVSSGPVECKAGLSSVPVFVDVFNELKDIRKLIDECLQIRTNRWISREVLVSQLPAGL